MLLIIDPFRPGFIKSLREMAIPARYLPDADHLEVEAEIEDAEVLLLNSKLKVDEALLAAAPRLKLIIRAGVGLDHIDVKAAEARGIRVENCAGANADAVGELTLAMLLALRRNLLRADAQVRDFVWKREANRGFELTGSTVGLIGYGHTGQAVARRLQGFGCEVLAYDKYRKAYGDEFAREAGMEEIFHKAQVLSLHVPLTAETRGMVDQEYLGQFLQLTYLLNLARGPVLNLPDVRDALGRGDLQGLGLDVLPNEKFQTLSPEEQALYQDLFQRENVLLTPHIGGWTDVSRENIHRQILQYLYEYLDEKA